MRPPRWLVHVVGAAVVVWGAAAAVSALLAARDLPPDPMAGLQADFAMLAPELPETGTIGYLEHYANAGADVEVRRYYAAQYALAPLVVVARTGPEYLIVAPGTPDPAGDPRLDDYRLAELFPNDLRIYRRINPDGT